MEGLKSSNTVLREFNKILKSSFGPYGKDVLMKSDTGVLYLAKDGGFVLRHLEVKHPVGILIKDTVENLNDAIGDFTKTFVILLACIVDALVSYFEASSLLNINEVNKELFGISSALLNLKEIIFPHNNKQNECCLDEISVCIEKEEEFFNKYLHGVLEVCLLGCVSKQTRDIFMRLAKHLTQHCNFSFENLYGLLEKFDDVLVTVPGIPFHESNVVDGLIIQRESTPNDLNMKDVNFVLITGDLIRRGADIEQDFISNFHSNTQFFTTMQNTEFLFNEKFLKLLKELSVSLVVAESAPSKTLQNMILSAGIAMVMYTPIEDLERISSNYAISPLSGLYDIFNVSDKQNFIGRASYFKSITLGTRFCCHLGASQRHSTTPLNIQIVVCCISEGLIVQYKRLLRHMLKVLLNTWGSTDKLFKLVPSCCTSEIHLSNIIVHLSKELACPYQRHVAKIVSRALLEIPKLIFHNSNGRDKDRFLFPLQVEHAHDKQFPRSAIEAKHGKIIDVDSVTLYEPMKSKRMMMETLLDFSAQLVRVQYVIPVVTATTINCSNHDEDGEESS